MRGNRTKKASTKNIVAFASPNFNFLGEVGVTFDIKWHRILRHNFEGNLRVFTDMSSDVSVINIQPCINYRVIEGILNNSKAVIIEAYGMGNIPTNNKELTTCIINAIKKDVIVVIKTQCNEGGVFDLYETGRYMVEHGAVLASDMTMECIIAKLSYLIGKQYSIPKIKKMMMQSLRGELTDYSKAQSDYSLKNNDIVKAIMHVMQTYDKEDIVKISQTVNPLLVNSLASLGNLELLNQLAKEGANFNSVDYRGRTALHIAAINRQTEIVKFLLTKDVVVDVLDNAGKSALYYACMNRQEEITTLLLQQGASAHAAE